MSNMSYCRFENTANDVEDCYDAICDNEFGNMSQYEIRGFVKFVELCKMVAEQYEDFSMEELKEYIKNEQDDCEEED